MDMYISIGQVHTMERYPFLEVSFSIQTPIFGHNKLQTEFAWLRPTLSVRFYITYSPMPTNLAALILMQNQYGYLSTRLCSEKKYKMPMTIVILSLLMDM